MDQKSRCKRTGGSFMVKWKAKTKTRYLPYESYDVDMFSKSAAIYVVNHNSKQVETVYAKAT